MVMRIGPGRTLAVFATVLALVGAAAAQQTGTQGWRSAAGDLDELRYRLSIIDAELAEIRARLGAAAPRTGGAAGFAPGGEVVVRLDRLEAELRRLTGRIEQLEFEQRRIAEEAARRFSDIEFRLTELEGGDPSALAPVPPLGSAAGAAGAGAATPAAIPEATLAERADLDRAIEDVRQGRFDIAEDRLRSFLTTYPGSPLEPEAYNWLGESQSLRGALAEAARSYLAGYKARGEQAMRARNLWRLGVVLGRLGQINEACLTLREVARQFPDAPEEVRSGAAAERRRLGCG